MRSKIALCPFLLAIACTVACSPLRYGHYAGPSRRWPTSSESLAETSFFLPVYRTWPEKRYDVLGSIRFEDPNKDWDDGIVKMVALLARSKGGNAIILRHGGEMGVGGLVGFSEDKEVWKQNSMTALVIKWKPQSFLDAEAATRRKLEAEFPELSGKPALLKTAIDCLEWRGTDLGTEGSQGLKTILTALGSGRDGQLGGKWLFKGTYSQRALTWSQSFEIYGLAAVTLNEGALTIISSEGPEISFSGSFDKGRVIGKMGMARTSASCEGVANVEKISLSGQAQVPDGTFQGNLILLR